jgi:hypothetical protein
MIDDKIYEAKSLYIEKQGNHERLVVWLRSELSPDDTVVGFRLAGIQGSTGYRALLHTFFAI